MQEKIVFAPYDRIVKFFLPIIPKKLKPNQLTFFRLICSPLLIGLLETKEYTIALIFFAILAITDMLDGSLARLRNQVTEWGKIWDPIADKLLIGTVVVVLLLKINLSLTIFLLAFELAFVLGGAFHKIGENGNHALQANMWGKIKMNLHCFGAGLLILGVIMDHNMLTFVAEILFYLSLLFAAVSLIKRGV
ncbi:MAG: CDP-alcohol phosphatidyltransferase family protein [Patescibacteria group bacterium]